MSDEETPRTPGEPLEPMSDADIVRYARGVITQEYMLANYNDRDWQHSLMLLVSGMAEKGFPPNASALFLVPMAPHASGRWLNGRVPGLTMSCTMVPTENVDALLAKCDEFYKLLHPEATVTPEVRIDET